MAVSSSLGLSSEPSRLATPSYGRDTLPRLLAADPTTGNSRSPGTATQRQPPLHSDTNRLQSESGLGPLIRAPQRSGLLCDRLLGAVAGGRGQEWIDKEETHLRSWLRLAAEGRQRGCRDAQPRAAAGRAPRQQQVTMGVPHAPSAPGSQARSWYGAGGLKPGTRLAILAGGFYRKHLGIATQVEKRKNLSCADGYDL